MTNPVDPLEPAPSPPGSSQGGRYDVPIGLAMGVGIVGAMVVMAFADPISRNGSHYGRMVLAAVGVIMVGWASLGMVRPAWRPRPLFLGVMAALCTIGWGNFYQYDTRLLTTTTEYTDLAYYYTNSKYLGEISYDGLYATALLCDRERGRPRTRHIRQVRDLRDYEMRTIAVAYEYGEQLKQARFTPERWDAYCHDITWFLDRIDRRALRSNFFVDHGYNPPPTWTLVGGNLAELVSVEHIKWICMVDTVLMAIMFGVAAWAFGLEVMFFAMLWFVISFSGRWPMLGHALMRFDWVAMLGIGMALLKRNHYGGAGAALAYAAWNRVFPAIFLLGWGLEALYDTIRERRVLTKHRRFVIGATIVTVVMVGGALASYGVGTMARSASNLRMHNETYSSHRVGLGDVLLYRGETTRAEINANGGIYQKELAIRELQWPLRGVGLLAMGLVAAYAWRRRDQAAWQLMPLAVLPFFCMTNPQINYYNLRVILVLWSAAQLDKPVHRWLLAMLFGIDVITQYTKVIDLDRYTTTVSTSFGLLAYLGVLVGHLIRSRVELSPVPDR